MRKPVSMNTFAKMANLNSIEPSAAFPTDEEKKADAKLREEGRADEIPFRQEMSRDGEMKWDAIVTYTTPGMFGVESETVQVSFYSHTKPEIGIHDSRFVFFPDLVESVTPANGKKRGAYNWRFSAPSMLTGEAAARAFTDAITTEIKALEALKIETEVALGVKPAQPEPAAPKASSNGKAKAGASA